jgi:hypothetical protein
LVVSGNEQKTKDGPEKKGMLVLNATFNTRNKSNKYWYLKEHRCCGHTWGDDLTTAGARGCGEQTIQRPRKVAI